tara:strand:- start:4350 stop:4532 length:183 start_codon:yes stop_codon:yes gene_type:complete
MANPDLLLDELIKNGKKQGLSEDFLKKIYMHLSKNQFLPAGEREHVRSDLQSLIRKSLED